MFFFNSFFNSYISCSNCNDIVWVSRRDKALVKGINSYPPPQLFSKMVGQYGLSSLGKTTD